jgi:hypothetical protein
MLADSRNSATNKLRDTSDGRSTNSYSLIWKHLELDLAGYKDVNSQPCTIASGISLAEDRSSLTMLESTN